MTDYQVTGLTPLTNPENDDVLLIVDVHDMSTPPAGPGGSDKKITVADLTAGNVSLTGDTMQGYLAPAVVTLADAATILVDAAEGNDFRVTLGGNRTMGAPSNPKDGQDITFLLTQDGTGGRTVAWASGTGGYTFGSGGAPALSTTPGDSDLVAFKYVAALTAWLFMGAATGFS